MAATTLPEFAPTLLIVDDEPLMTDLFRQYMTRIGYQVLTAGCASEALDIICEKGATVQIVVTDMSMPGMSGKELAETLQNLKPQIPVIITTGVDTSDASAQTSPNVVLMLQKPYQNRLLAEKIAEILKSAPVI